MEIIVQVHKMSICVLSLAWKNKLELLLKKKKQTKALVEHANHTQKGHHVGFACKENMQLTLITHHVKLNMFSAQLLRQPGSYAYFLFSHNKYE